MMSKIAVIIPAFNEALSIGQVVEALPNHVNEVIVVDNNSTDTTKTIAKEKGAKLRNLKFILVKLSSIK